MENLSCISVDNLLWENREKTQVQDKMAENKDIVERQLKLLVGSFIYHHSEVLCISLKLCTLLVT